MKKLLQFSVVAGWVILLASGVVAGCASKSYPSEKIKDALLDIVRKEYGIENLDVKIKGDTISVYLPLKQLFAADFKEAAVSGKVRNLETLFEPSPEAMEKVEDVLFSLSRVLLSTDREFKFYVLQATDEKTGLQLVLTGSVNDIRRVRIWDISRGEYRKRVIHELKINQAVVWHKPVHEFLNDLNALTAEQIHQKYFAETLSPKVIQNFFFNALIEKAGENPKVKWNVVDMRSTGIDKNNAVVYVKLDPEVMESNVLPDENMPLEYLFLIEAVKNNTHISRIVPFQYRDESGTVKKIPFPSELHLEKNIANWNQEFPESDIQMGDFLADQLTRRIQTLVSGDERIRNTFHEIKIKFDYEKEPPPPHFSLQLEALLRDFNNYSRDSIMLHEDVLYLLNIASHEFVEVLRSYGFNDYDYLSLTVAQEPSKRILGRERLELFRRGKLDLQGLLSLSSI